MKLQENHGLQNSPLGGGDKPYLASGLREKFSRGQGSLVVQYRSAESEVKLKSPNKVTEPGHDKTNKMACAPSEDSDQPGHPPNLIRVFAVRSLGS